MIPNTLPPAPESNQPSPSSPPTEGEELKEVEAVAEIAVVDHPQPKRTEEDSNAAAAAAAAASDDRKKSSGCSTATGYADDELDGRLSEITAPREEEKPAAAAAAGEGLRRHRMEMAGRVWIPEMWGQEGMLKEWIDSSVFDRFLVPKGLLSARDALAAGGGVSPKNAGHRRRYR